jgi:hypothetical protein
MTTKLNLAESTSASRDAADRTKVGGVLLHAENRGITDSGEVRRREKAMDDTLANSFPASDPPGWQL